MKCNIFPLVSGEVRHLVLADAEHEAPGVHLTVVPGIAGVDSLDPDSFFGLAAEASPSSRLGFRVWGLGFRV